MKFKRLISVFILLVYVLSVFPVNTFAAPDVREIDGNLTFKTTATTGTTGTVYSIIGWTIKVNGYTTRIKMEDSGSLDNGDGTRTYTYVIPFVGEGNTILQRFKDTYAGNLTALAYFNNFFKHGGTVYLDGIFTIKENGVAQGSLAQNGALIGETYTTESGIKGAREWGPSTISDLGQYWNLDVTFNPQAFPIKAIAAYWGKNTDGTSVQLAANEVKYSGSTTLGNPVNTPVVLDKTFSGYIFQESKLSYDTGNTYSGIIPGDPGKNRTVTMDENNDTVYVYFIFKQESTGTPTLGISADKTSVASGETYHIFDESEPSQGATAIISWTIKELFTPKGGGPIQTLQSKTITNPAEFFKSYNKTNEGTYEYVVTHVKDDAGNEITGNASVTITVGAAVPPPPSGIPVAIITAPATTRAGESITVSGSSSHSPNGPIETYTWSNGGGNGTPNSVSGMITYMYAGTYTIGLTVTDSAGVSASTTKTITVTPPYPAASFVVGGTLKENRRVIIDAGSSTSSPYYPINHALTRWTITPVSGGIAGDIKYTAPLNGNSNKYILFKKAGTYKINVVVENEYGLTDTTERIITIVPDEPPIAHFDAPPQVLRDPANGKKATISLTDNSRSVDGDTIGNRVWQYAYDSDNNGLFTDETYITLDSTNNKTSLSFTVTDVGKYIIRETVTEAFGQATIPEFVTGADYKTGGYQYTVEVINTPPVSSLTVKKIRNVDVSVVTDYVGAKLTALTSALSTLKSNVFAQNIDLNYTIIDGNNKVQVGEDLNKNRLVGTSVAMDTGSEYNYGYLGSFVPQIWITPSGAANRGGGPSNIVSVSTSSTGKMFCAVDANGNLYGWGEQPEEYLCPFPRPDDGSALTTMINFNGTYNQYNNYAYNQSGFSVKDALCLNNAIIALNNDGTLDIHGNETFHKTTYIAAGTGPYYAGKKNIDSDVVQVDGSEYTIIYLKSDGSVWGVGENQYYSAGPNASLWTQTWSGSVVGYGINTEKNKIPGLPKIKKIMHSATLASENTANPSTAQGRTVKETSFAIDENNQVWTWGFVLPGIGITPKVVRANDAYYISGRGIECIKTPEIIPGLDGRDIADISYGTYCTDPSVMSFAGSSHTLFVLKTDGTLWRFNNGTLTQVTTEAYATPSTNTFAVNKIYAIGSNWYLTAEGTLFGMRGNAWSNMPRYAYSYGTSPKTWLNPVYAPNLNALNISALRPGSERYFMWVSDGQGNDYTSGYGNYFGLSNLSTAFTGNIINANYAISAAGQASTFDYNSGFAAQNTTLRDFVNGSLINGRYYDAGAYQTALSAIASSYKANNKVAISVLTDYTGAKLTTLNSQLAALKNDMGLNGIDLTYSVNPGVTTKQVASYIKPGTVANSYREDSYYDDENGTYERSYIEYIKPANPYGFVSQHVGSSYGTSYKIYTAIDAQGKLYAWGNPYNYYGPYTPVPAVTGDTQINTPVCFNFSITLKSGGTLAGVTDKFIDSKVSYQTIFSLTEDGRLIVRGDPMFKSSGGSTALTYPTPTVLATDVKQIATGSMSVIMLKNDGTVWAYGNAQMGICGPWKSEYVRTSPNVGQPAVTPSPVKIELPPIKKVFAYQDTAFAADFNGGIWYWGRSYQSVLNMTANGQSKNYNGTNSGTAIRTIPEKLPNLTITDIYDIVPGDYSDSNGFRQSAIRILKNDKTLWVYNTYGFHQLTMEYYRGSYNYQTGQYNMTAIPVNNVVAIGNRWWADETGTIYNFYISSGYVIYEVTAVGTTITPWSVNVQALDINNFTTSTASINDTDKYFIWVSDGEGKNFSAALGTYFGLPNLSNSFISKLKAAYYNIVAVTQPANYNYNSELITQTATVRQMVDGSFVSGLYYDKGRFADAINDIKLQAYAKKANALNQYVIVNEDSVSYTPQYSDYESDPKNMEAWQYTHTPAYFENSQGTASFNGQWIASPIATFDKVGRYSARLRAQDNPKNNSNFMDYWLWGNASTDTDIIVHRRPIADFTFIVSPSGSNLILQTVNTSYDLDHQSGANKGITASRWKYKKVSDPSWTNGLPATVAANTVYQVSLEVQDVEGAWSNPTVKIVDTANLPPLVDAGPTSYDGSGPVNVTITANDQGENDFLHTKYAWTQSTAKPASWTTSTSKVIHTSRTTDGIWYLHMEAFDTAGNSTYVYRGPYRIVTLAITGVSISGYWNHWRGQVDLFGKQLTNEPHRFLSLETVKIDVATTGNADKMVIRFSPELEARQFTDQYGNRYDYRNDYFGHYVYFPADTTFALNSAQMNSTVHWEYTLPLAPSSVSWEDERLRGQYSMTVTVYKGADSVSYTIDDIDITGNVYDLTYIQPIH